MGVGAEIAALTQRGGREDAPRADRGLKGWMESAGQTKVPPKGIRLAHTRNAEKQKRSAYMTFGGIKREGPVTHAREMRS